MAHGTMLPHANVHAKYAGCFHANRTLPASSPALKSAGNESTVRPAAASRDAIAEGRDPAKDEVPHSKHEPSSASLLVAQVSCRLQSHVSTTCFVYALLPATCAYLVPPILHCRCHHHHRHHRHRRFHLSQVRLGPRLLGEPISSKVHSTKLGKRTQQRCPSPVA